MKNIKGRIIAIAVCTMVLFVSSMLAGCTINVNTGADKSSSADKAGASDTKKALSPTARPAQTPKPAQQTGNNGKSGGNNTEMNQDNSEEIENPAGEDTSGDDSSVDKTDGNDDAGGSESQLGDEVILHNGDVGDITVTRGDDGEFYDDNGVLYPDLDEASISHDLVINENGESFEWGPLWKEGDPDMPDQRATQAMMFQADGSSVLIKLSEDGNWYDENGVCFGDIDDALTAGEPVTNENGETYYWTLPE